MKGLEYKVGLFSIFGLLVIGYMFFALSPEFFKRGKRAVYFTRVKDAGGVVIKTHVKANGVVIGKVKDLILEDLETKIEIEVDGDVKIPRNSKLAIKEKGLLGDVFIDIMRGNDNGDYFISGDYIPPSKDHMGMAAMMTLAGGIGQDLKTITDSLSKAMGGDKGNSRVTGILENFYELSNHLKNVLGSNEDNVKNVMSNLHEVSETLKNALGNSNGKDFKNSIKNLYQITNDLAQLSQAIGGDKSKKLENALTNLDTILSDIRLISEKIKRGEGSIGRLLNDEDTLTEFEDTLKDVRSLLTPATKLVLDVDYPGEIKQSPSTQHFFNLWLKTREDRAYILGATQGPAIRKSTIEITSKDPVNSKDQTTIETVDEKKSIRINAQYAKRWGPTQIRFGLFETTGGIASDLYLMKDQLKISLEAYNWSSDSNERKNAHIKTFATLGFLENLYIMAGVDDLTRIDTTTGDINKKPNYFLGAGFQFTDNDIKTVVSTAGLAK